MDSGSKPGMTDKKGTGSRIKYGMTKNKGTGSRIKYGMTILFYTKKPSDMNRG